MKRFLLLASLWLSSCYKIDYVTGLQSSSVPTASEWHHIGIFGLVEFSEPVPLQQICPTGFAKVHNETSFANGAVTFALGLVALNWAYQPSTVSVYCKSGAAYNVDVDEQGLALSAERFE
jgi:hypothetical protein